MTSYEEEIEDDETIAVTASLGDLHLTRFNRGPLPRSEREPQLLIRVEHAGDYMAREDSPLESTASRRKTWHGCCG